MKLFNDAITSTGYQALAAEHFSLFLRPFSALKILKICQASLAYNIALCYYSPGPECTSGWREEKTRVAELQGSKQYGPALKHIAEIIERGVRDHPELSVGALPRCSKRIQQSREKTRRGL